MANSKSVAKVAFEDYSRNSCNYTGYFHGVFKGPSEKKIKNIVE
jgi:hypothetical protein